MVGAYETPMVIEGHTGSTDPPEYWQEAWLVLAIIFLFQ